jgi:hypothetical protein
VALQLSNFRDRPVGDAELCECASVCVCDCIAPTELCIPVARWPALTRHMFTEAVNTSTHDKK